MHIWAPGMPGISKVGSEEAADSLTSMSTSFSASEPSRSILRNLPRVSLAAFLPTSASSTRSSALSSALAATSLRMRSRVMWIETSTRSRTICSTSRPT